MLEWMLEWMLVDARTDKQTTEGTGRWGSHQTSKMTCAPSEDSNQPRYESSLFD